MPASAVRRLRRQAQAISHAQDRHAALRRHAGLFTAAALAAAALALMARPASADIMTMAPADAEVVVIVPNPEQMSDRVADLSTRIGVPIPGAQNLLNTMLGQMGNPQGIDRNRPVATSMGNAAEAMSLGDDSLMTSLVFVPVNDYGAFVSSLGGVSADGVTPLVMPDGSAAFVRQVEDYAVMGETEDAVTGYEPTDRARALLDAAGDYTDRLTTEYDLMFLMDMAKLGSAMADQAAAMENQMALGGGGMDAATADAMAANMASMAWFADLAAGADAALITADLEGDDVRLGMCAKFADGSPGSSILTGKPSGQVTPKFTTLPNMPYLMAFGMDLSGVDVAEFTRQMSAALPESAEAQRKMYDASIPMVEQVTGGAAGMYVPSQPAMGLAGLFNVAAVYDVDDADAFVQAFETYMKDVDGVAMPVPVPGPNGEMTTADITTQASVTPDALTLGGVSLAQWSMTQQMPPELMQQMGPMAGLMQQSYSGYIGGQDGLAYVTTGSDVALLQATVDGNDAGLTADGPTAAALGADPLPDRAIAGYVSLQGIGAMANNFIPMLGLPPFEVPGDLTPLGLSMGSSNDQMIVEISLPVDSVAYIVNEAMQLQAMMGGGMGGPGGGFDDPGPSRQGGDGAPRAPQ